MKRKSLIILFIDCILCSCKSITGRTERLSYNPVKMTKQLTQRSFDSSKAIEEMSRERTEKRIPFTMNYQWCFGKPVIDFDPEHHIYMQVDTGFTRNWYHTSLLRKMNLSDEDFMKEVIANIRKNHSDVSNAHPDDEELSNYLKKEWKNYNENWLAEAWIGDTVLRYDPASNPSFDGVLGEDFLMQYKRVTFDFVNNYLILDDEKLDGTEIPFVQTSALEVLINFTYKGQQELAMIDTGNYCFTPRHNLGDGKQDYDINDNSNYGLAYNGKVPVTPRVMQTYDDIKIGHVAYNNMKGAYSTIRGSGFVKGSQLHLMKLNNLGNVFFYDHVIQIDYADKVFIIK